MTCEEARTSMHFHLDGDDHLHVKNARQHTASCIQCERHILDLQEVEDRLRSLQRYAAPVDLKERILLAVRDTTQKRPLRAISQMQQM